MPLKTLILTVLLPLNVLYTLSWLALPGCGSHTPGSFVLVPLILFFPGLLCVRIDRDSEQSIVYPLSRGLVISLCFNVCATIFCVVFDFPRSPESFLLSHAMLANSFILLRFITSWRDSQKPETSSLFSCLSRRISHQVGVSGSITLVLYFCLMLSLLYFTAGMLPLLWDHETYLIGAAYGLMDQLKPTTWPSLPDDTFRTTNLSKPPLTFLYTAWSVLLTGFLAEAEPFYHAAFLEEDKRPMATEYWVNGEKTDFPGEVIANAAGGNGRGVRLEVEPGIPVSDSLRFAARIPHAFAFWLSGIMLLVILRNRKVSLQYQILGVLLYYSMPENIIRGSSASTDPLASLIFMFLVYFFLDEEQSNQKARDVSLFTVSLLLYWSHQKTVVCAIAIFCWHFAREESIRKILTDRVILGYIAGFATFSLYSLLCDPADFFHAFLSEQNAGRFNLFSLLPPEDRVYPDVIHLWSQFNTFLGSPFLLLGVGTLLLTIRRHSQREGIFLFWFVVTAILASLMDWRMTRHLVVGIIPLIIGFILVIDRWPWQWKYCVSASVAYIVIMNCSLDWTILTDFARLAPLPTW